MNYHEFRSRVRSEYPDLWRSLHPRTYSGADAWCDPALPATAMALHCIYFGQGGPPLSGADSTLEARSAVSGTTVLLASSLVRHRVPAFHVSSGFLDAVSQSTPLRGVCWLTEPLPFPAGLLLLPRHNASGAQWVGWCRLEPNASYSIPGHWVRRTLANRQPKFLIAAGSQYGESHYDIFAIGRDDGNYDSHFEVESNAPNGLMDYAAVVSVLTNTLLALSARPELVERDGRRVRVIKNGPAREEWTPNWIGRTYRLQRADGDDTHASPRLHWRRGHFRQQPHGPGGKDRKTIWLEPVLVGAS